MNTGITKDHGRQSIMEMAIILEPKSSRGSKVLSLGSIITEGSGKYMKISNLNLAFAGRGKRMF